MASYTGLENNRRHWHPWLLGPSRMAVVPLSKCPMTYEITWNYNHFARFGWFVLQAYFEASTVYTIYVYQRSTNNRMRYLIGPIFTRIGIKSNQWNFWKTVCQFSAMWKHCSVRIIDPCNRVGIKYLCHKLFSIWKG